MISRFGHVAHRQNGDTLELLLLDEKINDDASTEMLREMMAIVDREKPKKVAVVCDRVEQVTSNFINSMIILRRELKNDGVQLELLNMIPNLREQFRRLNLEGSIFEIR